MVVHTNTFQHALDLLSTMVWAAAAGRLSSATMTTTDKNQHTERHRHCCKTAMIQLRAVVGSHQT